jgi:DNA-binding MurR/RpiR family transcriptional regulator
VSSKITRLEALTDISAFVAEVRASHATLPRKLQQIADYTHQFPDRVALDSITELAHQIGTHPSTLVRFSQHFGFSGFSELQRLYRDHLRSNSVGYSSRLEGIDDVGAADVLRAITQSAVQSATDLEASLDSNLVGQAVQLLASANTIWLAGSGRTVAVQSYFQYLFTGLSMVSHALGSNLDQVGKYVDLMRPDDVLVATSFRSYSQATSATVTKARAAGIPCVCLTDTEVSPIYGPVSLLYSEDQFAGFRSLSATMSLALYLAIEAGRQRKETQNSDISFRMRDHDSK